VRLLKTIEEQAVFGFSGKVNIMDAQSGQYYGAIYLDNGLIVNAIFKGVRGRKGLMNGFIYSLTNEERIKHVVEPELIDEDLKIFEISFDLFVEEFKSIYSEYQEVKKLRPPESLRVVLNGEFVVAGSEVTSSEFDVMKTISIFNKVRDIYDNCPLMEVEITRALVGLRKKKAIKVVSI